MPDSPARTPSALLPAYLVPYLAYVALGSLADAHTHAPLVYGARLVFAGGSLAYYWRSYPQLAPRGAAAGSAALGALVGLGGTALWIALHAPFARADAPAWPDSAWLARALGATALPPLVEELLFRGFAFKAILLVERARRAASRTPLADALDRSSLDDVAPGAWSALAVLGSSALFAAGHWPAEWPAAFAYGVLMCALWIARGDLLSCISAHAVTNAALAVFVRESGRWGSW
jgi:CAAX protease family protein